MSTTGTSAAQPKDRSNDWPALMMGLMLVLTPAMGVPAQELLQDTLKSMLVVGFTLAAAFILVGTSGGHFWRWHPVLALPLLLCLYALGSTTWSHSYLATIECLRWMMFALIVWVGLHTLANDKTYLALWGMHWGATIASMWAAAQFWFDFQGFPQGPQPASTFVNRNFFAEYAICVLPYSIFLISRSREKLEKLAVTSLTAFNVSAVLMTGTRSAILTLILLAVPMAVWWGWSIWTMRARGSGSAMDMPVIATFLATLLVFGLIPSGNSSLEKETGDHGAIPRAVLRIQALPSEQKREVSSLSMRADLTLATIAMIKANPLLGVGAGAWEVEVPRFQKPDTQTEIDYYAHNEPLQLVAEYGFVGILFLVLLAIYLFRAALQTWKHSGDAGKSPSGLRLAALASIAALMAVSLAGFPWRLAGTGVIFAVGLAVLASTKTWTRHESLPAHGELPVGNRSAWGIAALMFLTAAYGYASYRAVIAERNLVQSLQLALELGKVRDKTTDAWKSAWIQATEAAQRGIATNPHYRKITAAVGDAFAQQGDWENALKAWKPTIASRPYVVSILCNIARAHLELGQVGESEVYFSRAKALRPDAPAVQSLAVYREIYGGNLNKARGLVMQALDAHPKDPFLARLAIQIGSQTDDWQLLVFALRQVANHQPLNAAPAWLRLGTIYADSSRGNSEKEARECFLRALETASKEERGALLTLIPPKYRP